MALNHRVPLDYTARTQRHRGCTGDMDPTFCNTTFTIRSLTTTTAFTQNSSPYCNPNAIVEGLWCSEYGVRVRVRL